MNTAFFGGLQNLPDFIAVIVLYVKRGPLVNGNAIDHIVLALPGYFWPAISYWWTISTGLNMIGEHTARVDEFI